MPAKPILPLQFDASVVSQLACPACHGDLRLETTSLDALHLDVPGSEASSRLLCIGCGRAYPIVDGIPVLIADCAEAATKQD